MVKTIAFVLPLLLAACVSAQDKKPTTLREVLLAELRSTHTNPEWSYKKECQEKSALLRLNADLFFSTFSPTVWT
jgi:hypothetical protein